MTNITENHRQIELSELPADLPDFDTSYESKDSVIKNWIIKWILSSVKKNLIKENDIMPKKSDISNYLGVSIGTVQNAIRYVEDAGFLKSKQKLGTMISNFTNPISDVKKSTSKRDKAIIKIKKIIADMNIKPNKPIPSTRKMSEYIGVSQNTTRLAYEYLCNQGIIESKKLRGNEANWILVKIPNIDEAYNSELEIKNSDTLVDIITEELRKFLAEKYTLGAKIPPHEELAKILNVSVKTIHDSIKKLNDEGVLISKRGRYGTILAQNPLNPKLDITRENSIFLSAKDAEFYSYQKIENNISSLLCKEYNIGDKLPSMSELSKRFDVSTNTVRRALNNLADQGYITFGRGRYGGTFIVDKPETIEKQQYQWIAINPKYI